MLPFCGLQPDADHAHVELIPAAGGTLYLRHSVLEEWLPLWAAEATLGRNDHGYAVVDFGDGKPRLAHELFLKTVHTAAGGVQHVHEKAIDSCSLLVDLHRQHAAKVFEVASQKDQGLPAGHQHLRCMCILVCHGAVGGLWLHHAGLQERGVQLHTILVGQVGCLGAGLFEMWGASSSHALRPGLQPGALGAGLLKRGCSPRCA